MNKRETKDGFPKMTTEESMSRSKRVPKIDLGILDELDINLGGLTSGWVVRDDEYKHYHGVTLSFTNNSGVPLFEVTMEVLRVERSTYQNEVKQALDIIQKHFTDILDKAREMASRFPDVESDRPSC